MKKAALDKLNADDSVLSNKTDREWTDDKNLMEWLANLGQ